MTIEFYLDGVRYLNCAIFPFNFEDVLDATLDSASITLDRLPIEVIEPLTPITIVIKSEGALGEEQLSLDWIVATDVSEEAPVGSELYRHSLSLIEPTKFLEGFVVDSICVTHPGGNVYTNNAKPVEPEET